MPVLVLRDDGQWEPLGAGRDRDVFPEGARPSWDNWGSQQLAFTLARDPEKDHPDLAAYTPVRYHPPGGGREPAWGGFIEDAPAAGDGIAVNCLGLAALLDFDPFSKIYVHSRLGEWVDQRSIAEYNPLAFRPGPGVEVSPQGASLIFPKGHVVNGGENAGITLDLGPDNSAEKLLIDYTRIGAADANCSLLLRGRTVPNEGVGGELLTVVNPGVVDGVSGGGEYELTAGPWRYLHLFARHTLNGALGFDSGFKVHLAKVYTSDSYYTFPFNTLTVIKHALAQTLGLDPSVEDLVGGPMDLPAFGAAEERTARTEMERVNAYHRYLLRVTPRGRLQWRERPARATLEASTRRDGFDFQDASRQAGQELYNKVKVRGLSGSGRPLTVTKRTIDLGIENVLDRRGWIRTKVLDVQSPTDTVPMTQLANVWLQRYGHTPLKGTATVQGRGVRDARTGHGIPAGYLGTRVGELILLGNLRDPDTGARGRVAAMVGVPSYDEATDTATIAIDNTRDDVDAVLERMAVVQGS